MRSTTLFGRSEMVRLSDTLVPPERLRAVSFDIGHTLIRPHPSLGHIYADTAANHGVPMPPHVVEERFDIYWTLHKNRADGLIYGRTHEEAKAFWLRVIRDVMADTGAGDTTLQRITNDLYDTFSTGACWRLHGCCHEVLRACSDAGLKVAFLSNWDLRLRQLLIELDLVALADAVIISAEHAVEKPDVAIFHRVTSELAVPASSVLHVGDTWDDDVVGAIAAGFRAVWLNPHGKERPDPHLPVAEIADLGEVVGLL